MKYFPLSIKGITYAPLTHPTRQEEVCSPVHPESIKLYTGRALVGVCSDGSIFRDNMRRCSYNNYMVRKLVPSATPTSTTSTSICAEIGCFLNLENNVNLHMLSLRCVGFSFLVPQKYTNLDDFTPFSGNNFCGSIFFCWMMISI